MSKEIENWTQEKIDTLFKHKITGKVQFADIDYAGIAHNIKYLYWIEYARTEYFSALGIQMHQETFTKEFPVMVVHSEIDYFNFARFFEEYEVYTRIAFIKKSSFGFENIVKLTNGKILAFAKAVMVYLNKDTHLPEKINENIKNMIKAFEGENVKILE